MYIVCLGRWNILSIILYSYSIFLPFPNFLVYDTSNRDTFNKLEEWLNEVEVYSTKRDIIKMLVGNKIDKVGKHA